MVKRMSVSKRIYLILTLIKMALNQLDEKYEHARELRLLIHEHYNKCGDLVISEKRL